MFGCSDNCIRKWCKSHSLLTPPQGYWEKLKHGYIIDYEI